MLKKNVYLVTVILTFLSCASPEKVLYLQDIEDVYSQQIAQDYEVIIHKDDLIAIMVNSKNPELALPFNMPMVSYQLGVLGSGQPKVLGYLVDSQGEIDFPILGKIKVEGLTRAELTTLIKTRLIEDDLINDPVVTVQFLNYKISVIGEVARPGSFSISGDRITLLEALSMAGDLTIYGKRDRVAVIRELDGERLVQYHDIRSSEIFTSPFYYLQQNDIVYVEPNRTKIGQSKINQNTSVSTWVSIMSLLTSVAILIFK